MLHDLFKELGIPPRTQLTPLKPIGVGTTHVESLMSYLHRLADVHGIRLPNLVTHFCPGRRELSGWRVDHLGLTEKFSELTHQSDLTALTVGHWKSLISYVGLHRTCRAWCPDCLVEMSVGYQPLLWNMASVSCCTRHNRPLLTSCPNCSKKLTMYAEGCISRKCNRCKTDLCSSSPAETPSEWERWKAVTCGELLAHPERTVIWKS